MEKIKFDYSKLKGRITEKCGTQKAFSEALGVSEGTLVSKLQCKTFFTQNEIARSIMILDIPLSDTFLYFFSV